MQQAFRHGSLIPHHTVRRQSKHDLLNGFPLMGQFCKHAIELVTTNSPGGTNPFHNMLVPGTVRNSLYTVHNCWSRPNILSETRKERASATKGTKEWLPVPVPVPALSFNWNNQIRMKGKLKPIRIRTAVFVITELFSGSFKTNYKGTLQYWFRIGTVLILLVLLEMKRWPVQTPSSMRFCRSAGGTGTWLHHAATGALCTVYTVAES